MPMLDLSQLLPSIATGGLAVPQDGGIDLSQLLGWLGGGNPMMTAERLQKQSTQPQPTFGSLAPELVPLATPAMKGTSVGAARQLQSPEAAPPPAYNAPLQQDYLAGIPKPPTDPMAPAVLDNSAAAPMTAAQPGPAPDPADADNSILPPGATPTMAGAPGGAPLSLNPLTPPAPRAAPAAAPSLLERLSNGLNNNSDLLLSLGAGFAGAGSLGEGMQRAFANARPLAGRNQTVDALVSRGLPPDLARAAASNPAILQQLIPQLFGAKQLQHVTIKNSLGAEIPLVFDPARGQYTLPNGQPYGKQGQAAGSSAPAAPGIDMASAVTAYHQAQGDQKDKVLDQIIDAHGDPSWSAEEKTAVRAATKAFINGDVMPTGNPRVQGATPVAKNIGQQVGQALGLDVSDTTYPQKRTMLNSLAVSTPSSLGGQINFAGTSLEHLATTADKIVDLNNSGGFGAAPLAKGLNYLRQLGTDQAGKANAVQGAAQHFGQEVTKFYSGSPGGEAERTRFLKSLDTAKSPTELADALQTERDLIPGRLDQLATQIKTTLGEHTPRAQKELGRIEEAKKAIPRIDGAIAKLRGEKKADAQAEPAAPAANLARPTTPAERDALAPGTPYLAPDGSTRVRQ